MAKDDYFVIVYQLLKYLYECVKCGVKPDPEKLTAMYFNVPDNYWAYILISLKDDQYIKGIKTIPTKDGILFSDLSDLMITPKGIQYLFENSLLEKAKKTLKDLKDVVPFL
ncbi:MULTISPECIES: YjcQ family protein [unclassified Facklamia]|uniref:YjcQ family protein n=1 Tax=Aerococcaceae TaxID=186827 RepID=UPI0013B78D50|nr:MULTISPECIES: YjcQ family protein [unclassified Facklamia]MBS4462826.1 hypothetical protein [Aerococcaceae bacterium zg-B36]NEW65275.1 hypothetical protein [Facklamia sp. 252]NEW68745.1 hypothetical protein [Facklamia sp. 253]QQD66133.1 hypothetical protein JDW14_03235 [Aerococcaceae bacterium zg-252]